MNKMALTKKGLNLMLAGAVVMIAGYILMTGGNSDDPRVFDYGIYDFRRLVAAPIVIVSGIVVEIIAIMGCNRKNKEEK